MGDQRSHSCSGVEPCGSFPQNTGAPSLLLPTCVRFHPPLPPCFPEASATLDLLLVISVAKKEDKCGLCFFNWLMYKTTGLSYLG